MFKGKRSGGIETERSDRTGEREISREEAVITSVERWLSNPALRAILRFVCGRSSTGENRLEKALRRYVGEKVQQDIQDKLAYIIVSLVVSRGTRIFDYPSADLKKFLKDPVIRRGLANVLEGIAKFGARRPFTGVAPFLVVWDYTRACNLNCKHCYENAGGEPTPEELTTEEKKEVIDEFADAGVVAIAFSGGEPLMAKDIFEVAGHAKDKGFFTSIATNGTLITPGVAGKLKEVFDYAEISLDGFEEVHDSFRGVPGAWRRTCEGIKNCVRAGVDTCVALTATKYNVEEIPRLVDFAEKELGVKRVIVFNYVPTGRGKEIVKQDLSPEEREKLLMYLYSRMMNSGCRLICYSTAPQYSMVSWKYAYEVPTGGIVTTHFTTEWAMEALRGRTKSLSEFLGGCGAGRLYCGLEPNGDIVPCVFMPIKIGNIRQDRLLDVWDRSEVLWRLRIREGLEGCGDCEYLYICGGCRARAYGYFGDVRKADPGCLRNLKYWEALRAQEASLAGTPAAS